MKIMHYPRRNCFRMAVALLLLFLLRPTALSANEKDNEVDSEDIFGFTSGTDLPELNQRQGELAFAARWGKPEGTYRASSSEFALKYMALPNTQFALSASVAHHHIRSVTDLDDRKQVAFEEVGFEVKHRFLDRSKAPFGMALSMQPFVGRVDEITGEKVSEIGTGFVLAFDRELLSERLFGALNILYDFSRAVVRATGETEKESSFGASVALTWQMATGLFLGGEARYLRSYEGLALDSFQGEALFVGPTFNYKFAKCCFIAAAWNAQVWGREHGVSGKLDLTNFERHQATVKVGFDF